MKKSIFLTLLSLLPVPVFAQETSWQPEDCATIRDCSHPACQACPFTGCVDLSQAKTCTPETYKTDCNDSSGKICFEGKCSHFIDYDACINKDALQYNNDFVMEELVYGQVWAPYTSPVMLAVPPGYCADHCSGRVSHFKTDVIEPNKQCKHYTIGVAFKDGCGACYKVLTSLLNNEFLTKNANIRIIAAEAGGHTRGAGNVCYSLSSEKSFPVFTKEWMNYDRLTVYAGGFGGVYAAYQLPSDFGMYFPFITLWEGTGDGVRLRLKSYVSEASADEIWGDKFENYIKKLMSENSCHETTTQVPESHDKSCTCAVDSCYTQCYDPKYARNSPDYEPGYNPFLNPESPLYDPRIDPSSEYYDSRFDPKCISNAEKDPNFVLPEFCTEPCNYCVSPYTPLYLKCLNPNEPNYYDPSVWPDDIDAATNGLPCVSYVPGTKILDPDVYDTVPGYGETPTLSETARAIHVLTNAARADVQRALDACGAPCQNDANLHLAQLKEGSLGVQPLFFDAALYQSARLATEVYDACKQNVYAGHYSPCHFKANAAELALKIGCDKENLASCICEDTPVCCNPAQGEDCQTMYAGYPSPADRFALFFDSVPKTSSENISYDPRQAEPRTMLNGFLFEDENVTHTNGHRKNILNRQYNALGISIYAPYWGQEFADLKHDIPLISMGSHFLDDGKHVFALTAGDGNGRAAKIHTARLHIGSEHAIYSMPLEIGLEQDGLSDNAYYAVHEAQLAPELLNATSCIHYYFDIEAADGSKSRFPASGTLTFGSCADNETWSNVDLPPVSSDQEQGDQPGGGNDSGDDHPSGGSGNEDPSSPGSGNSGNQPGQSDSTDGDETQSGLDGSEENHKSDHSESGCSSTTVRRPAQSLVVWAILFVLGAVFTRRRLMKP